MEGIGLNRGSWMGGMAVAINNFTPVNDESVSSNHEYDHAGKITVFSPTFFGLYGISSTLNLTLSFPYIYWKQYAVQYEDNHHRNEYVDGFGDLTLGVRGLLINQYYGPGQRLFIDGAVVLPAGKDYALNPFGSNADSIEHRHFALGSGQISYILGAEWWWRSEFPLILGISSKFRQALNESRVGYKPGAVASVNLHAIRQMSIIKSIFPYLELELLREWPDIWNGEIAANSGAISLNASGHLIYEVSEQSSLVFTISHPVWQTLEGSQLSGTTFAVSYRFQSY